MSTETTPACAQVLWRCVDCGGPMDDRDDSTGPSCGSCGRSYPVRDEVVIVEEEQSGNNEIAREFYDGPLWPKFRFWEWFTFVCNGGERRSRQRVLRHLPQKAGLKLLDVAVGDGVYLPWLPEDWEIVGIDISPVQLAGCRDRAGDRPLTLTQGGAENLPYRDGYFDAILSIGGFNYFNDPERSLREMARVTRPGGTIVISDEVPDLTDYLPGHKFNLGPLKKLERWWIARRMHLGDEFTDLVDRYRDLDVAAIGRRVLPDCRYELIWRGAGYVMVGTVPESVACSER